MASELDRLDEYLDGANSQYCTANADVLVDQVRFYHGHRENLIEVVETKYYHPLVTKAVYIQANVIEAESNRLYHVIWVLVNILEELLDVRVAT